jgi:hypothetical protein
MCLRRATPAHWVIERYCYYSLDAGGRMRRREIDHPR